MSTIEARLAQDIVDRTMRIIPFNVNVMDGRGIILGSGETSRIGELHSGALLALALKGRTPRPELPGGLIELANHDGQVGVFRGGGKA